MDNCIRANNNLKEINSLNTRFRKLSSKKKERKEKKKKENFLQKKNKIIALYPLKKLNI